MTADRWGRERMTEVEDTQDEREAELVAKVRARTQDEKDAIRHRLEAERELRVYRQTRRGERYERV